ncbi:MAG: hypothetical protein AAFV93_01965 [Chloroflexota bacterium]
MPLRNHTLIMQMIKNYRLIHIDGRYASGKTALTFRLAEELLRHHGFRYLYSNVSSVWNDDPNKFVLNNYDTLDAVLVLDEAGTFLSSKKDWEQWTAALRKLNVVLIAPSVEALPARKNILVIERESNYQTLGAPVWRYVCYQETRRKTYKYTFDWVNPSEIFGVYSTSEYPTDAKKLSQVIANALIVRDMADGNKERAMHHKLNSAKRGIVTIEL